MNSCLNAYLMIIFMLLVFSRDARLMMIVLPLPRTWQEVHPGPVPRNHKTPITMFHLQNQKPQMQITLISQHTAWLSVCPANGVRELDHVSVVSGNTLQSCNSVPLNKLTFRLVWLVGLSTTMAQSHHLARALRFVCPQESRTWDCLARGPLSLLIEI